MLFFNNCFLIEAYALKFPSRLEHLMQVSIGICLQSWRIKFVDFFSLVDPWGFDEVPDLQVCALLLDAVHILHNNILGFSFVETVCCLYSEADGWTFFIDKSLWAVW